MFNLEMTEPEQQIKDDRFDEFWPENSRGGYARKQGNRKKAKSYWSKLTDQDKTLILADIKIRYKETERQHMPYPTSYLNGEYWKREIEEVVVKMPRTNDEWTLEANKLGLMAGRGETWPKFKDRISAAMRNHN